MFNSSLPGIDVSIRTIDGSVMRGQLTPGITSSLESALNKDSPFLEFTSVDGQKKYIAKGQISYIEPVEPLKKPQLNEQRKSLAATAHAILGVSEGCTYEQAREAFHAKAKLYHPDKFTTVELPSEVQAYLNDMFRQVNAAFTELRAILQQQAA